MANQQRFGLHFFPLAVFILFPLTFAITYSVAVKLDHILPFFAYISDTGTFAPEMCIFGLGLSMAMVFVWATAYIRYKQVDEYFKQRSAKGSAWSLRWNKIGLLFGIIAGFGTCVVGAFQEISVLSVHILGAVMAFGGGSIFLIIHGFFTRRMAPQFGSNSLGNLRIFMGVACFFLFLTSLGTGAQAMKYFTGEKAVKWEPHHGGWVLRVTSVVTEWVMAALFDLYFLTFVPEFKRIGFVAPQFRLVEVTTIDGGKGGGRRSVVHEPVNINNNVPM